MTNILLRTDVYKFGHKAQYPEGTDRIYSYLCARGSRLEGVNSTVFFGLQYYLKKYLKCPTRQEVEEFQYYAQGLLGRTLDNEYMQNLYDLADLGYLPIEIKAVREGSVVGTGNVLMTIVNTHPKFFWLVNYIETLLLKVWSPMTVATNSLRFKKLFDSHANKTCDNNLHTSFQMHDFGYRGVSSEETAETAGAGHLTSFKGTDTTMAVVNLDKYYNKNKLPIGRIGCSIPASEHSVMCAHSVDNDDYFAIENMIKTHPAGAVSIVSDTYNLWRAISYMGVQFKNMIMSRNGKVVVRPDSGDPVKIICGDSDAEKDSPEYLGVIRLLDMYFGHTVNSKGYKELDSHVGCIYGDAIFYERADEILTKLAKLGYASSNIVFGSGGLLLQQWSRDTFKMAIKATYCEVNGESRQIMKDPITDKGKRSHKGCMVLLKDDDGTYETIDECTLSQSIVGCLEVVYRNGKVLIDNGIDEIRQRIVNEVKLQDESMCKESVQL